MLSRATRLDTSSMQHSLLRLQMRYGNQYVGRVLSRAAGPGEPERDMGVIEHSIDMARGGGHGMDHGTRARMESAFGADFSGVRIHTDAQADSLNRSLSARAFTTGHDVFFRHGEYNPGTSSGRELLAHELTHVVQQNGGSIRRKMTVSQPGDPHEVEADEMARAVIRQEHAPVAGQDAISRDDDGRRAATKAAGGVLLRQPEAPNPKDEEDKKRPHGAPDPALLSRDKVGNECDSCTAIASPAVFRERNDEPAE